MICPDATSVQHGRIFSGKGRIKVEKEGKLRKMLSLAVIQLGRGEILLVNKQHVFFSTSNCTSCKERDKLLVK